MDTLLAMIRRLLGSLLPEQAKSRSLLHKFDSIFSPDTAHIHHRLVARGFSHRNAVLVLYLVSVAFGLGAFAVTTWNTSRASVVLFTAAIATFIGIKQLRYREIAVFRNGILLPMYDWPIMNHRLFQSLLDLGFINLAYAAAYVIGSHSQLSTLLDKASVANLSIVCGVQFLVFYFSGLHKGSFRDAGMGDVLRTLKTIALAVVITGIVFALRPNAQAAFSLTTGILDFYILLSLVLGSRISYHMLNYFFRKENGNGGKRVVIYGAGSSGLLTLQQILSDKRLKLTPVGFLDDTTHLEGKHQNGYPIFGGHWKIPKIHRQLQIEEIILSDKVPLPEIMKRLKSSAKEYGIKLQKLQVDLVDVSLESEGRPLSQLPVRIKEGERILKKDDI